jgi:hypothetical protein
MTRRTGNWISVLLILLGAEAARAQIPVGTAFTYQGELHDNNLPVNGSTDLAFSLWNAAGTGCPPVGGMQVGTTIPMTGVTVTDGLFTVVLNQAGEFGATAFAGSARWLQVSVGGTPLCPRQELTPTPYCLFGVNAATAASAANATQLNGQTAAFYQNASNLNAGTLPSARLSGTYSGALSFSSASNSFTGNGTGLTSLNASNISSGTLGIARFPTGGSWALSSGLNIDSGTLFVDPANSRVGVGTSVPDANAALSVLGNIAIPWGSSLRTTNTGQEGRIILDIDWNATAGDYVEFYAPGAGTPNLVPQLTICDRKGVIVDPAGTNAGNLGADTLGLRFGTPGSGEGIASKRTAGGNVNGLDFYTNFMNRMTITNSGNVGIGSTTLPAEKLYVNGDVKVQGDFCATGQITSCLFLSESDARLKTDVCPLTGGLDGVERLRPVRFNWNRRRNLDRRHSDQPQIGLIAQEVREVVPEAVAERSDGYLAVDYSRLTPILIQAMRELRAEKDQQLAERDAQIADLTARLEKLERANGALDGAK